MCSVKPHPTADVTALVFKRDQSLRPFKLGEAPVEIGEFYLGTEVISHGYPSRQEGPDKVVLEPRLRGGHIQRNFRYDQGHYSFHACELSFPAILGQSGSPILLKDDIDFAIAVLTRAFSAISDASEEAGRTPALPASPPAPYSADFAPPPMTHNRMKLLWNSSHKQEGRRFRSG